MSRPKSRREATQSIVVMWLAGRGVWLICPESDTYSLQAVKLKIFSVTPSSFYSRLHSSLFHFYPLVCLIFQLLIQSTFILITHKSNSQTCRVASFSRTEMKIPLETIAEFLITRFPFAGVVKYFVPWLTEHLRPCLYECVNTMWFSSSVKV